MTRIPTEKQYDSLRTLGSGAAGLAWKRSVVKPLLRWGWVTAEDPDGTYFQMVRITPTGLRALAEAVELYGLPELSAPARTHVRVCDDCGSQRWRSIPIDVDPRTGREVAA